MVDQPLLEFRVGPFIIDRLRGRVVVLSHLFYEIVSLMFVVGLDDMVLNEPLMLNPEMRQGE
jgi:hypothetical protein